MPSLAEIRKQLKRVRKAVIALGGTALQIVNFTVPEYGDEVQFGVGLVVAVLTAVITYQVPNAKS